LRRTLTRLAGPKRVLAHRGVAISVENAFPQRRCDVELYNAKPPASPTRSPPGRTIPRRPPLPSETFPPHSRLGYSQADIKSLLSFFNLSLHTLYLVLLPIMDQISESTAYARATETASHIRSKLPSTLQNPKVAIVCGSGLGGLVDTIEDEPKVSLAYGDIPNFPQSTGK
jgi:hypothetical protein